MTRAGCDASELLGELIAIAPRAARDEELRSLHAWDYQVAGGQ